MKRLLQLTLVVALAVTSAGWFKHGLHITPSLNNAVATATGQTTASASVNTVNAAFGTLYQITTTNGSTPSATQIKNGQDASGSAATASGNQAVSSLGTQSFSISGLTASTAYFNYVVQQIPEGDFSNVTTASFATSGGGGGPLLSGQVAQADGVDWFFSTVSTDTGSGTLFWTASTTNGLTPTAAQVKAGTVSGAVANSSQAVSSSGTQTVNQTGLSAASNYTIYYVQNSGSDSNVVGTGQFTTAGNITFNPTYTANYLAAQGGAIATATTNALSLISNCFASSSGNITVNYKFDFLSGFGIFAQTFPSNASNSYTSAIRPRILALNSKNKIQHTLYDSPLSSDPFSQDNWFIANAQSQNLGGIFVGTPDSETDLGDCCGTWDTTSDCHVGGFCVLPVILHEATEGMGRQWEPSEGGESGFTTYSAYSSAGNRTNVGTGTHFPSIDGGATSLIAPSQYATGQDKMDWNNTTTDAFNANYSQITNLTDQDVAEITKIGFPLQHSCRVAHGISIN